MQPIYETTPIRTETFKGMRGKIPYTLEVSKELEDGWVVLTMTGGPLLPLPRGRAGVTKSGRPFIFQSKETQQFKSLAKKLPGIGSLCDLPDGPLEVDINVFRKKPKQTKLSAPRGDIDNYAKMALDFLQWAGVLDDDDRVQELTVTKGWAEWDTCEIRIQSLSS